MEYKNFHIITPCYNHQSFLNRCIQSIEDQNYPKEFIKMTVIDDFSDIPLKTMETSFNLKKIRNNKRLLPALNRYKVYKNCLDYEIIIFLDGDDWLNNNNCLSYLNKIYCQNNIDWAISNHKIFKENKTKILPKFVELPLETEKPKICHLRTGYGYVWNKMNLDWIKFEKDESNTIYIKWMSDWNENLYAMKFYGQPFKINCSLSTYNLDTSKTKNENSNFNEMIMFLKKNLIRW